MYNKYYSPIKMIKPATVTRCLNYVKLCSIDNLFMQMPNV